MAFVVKGAVFSGEIAQLSPVLHNWSRLEPLPVSVDLETNLRARLGDPLFLLGRQWQFNEFQGEDAGTPIDVRLEVARAPVDRFHLGPFSTENAATTSDLRSDGPPLETIVEAESSPRTSLRAIAESGLDLVRRLRAAGLDVAARAVLAAFPLELASTDPVSDATGVAWLGVLRGRALDSDAVAALVEPLLEPDGTLSAAPTVAGYTPTAVEAESFSLAVSAWYRARQRTFESGDPSRSAWVPQRQEHSFQLRAQPARGASFALDSTEYADGRLDWHSFVLRDDPGLGEPAEAVPNEALVVSPKLPTPVRYPGMPADRFWEFEDGKVTFGRTTSGPTELMRLLLIEFALVYGNDWFYVPFELPVGSLATIARFKVRDTFGVELDIPAASSVRRVAGRPWRWFELTDRRTDPGSWFFLPPALPARLSGDPLEEVALFRDEMANMAWGVERQVQSPIAGSIDRSLERYESTLHQAVDGAAIDAELVYRLETDVPDRWIPLVPVAEQVPTPGTPGFVHWLERKALIRTLPDGSRRTIHPRGQLLRSDPSLPVESEPPLRLAEEEVPREGAIVRRSYQYTRWLDGTSHLWLGRDKTTSRGEGASNLRFDLLVRRATPK